MPEPPALTAPVPERTITERLVRQVRRFLIILFGFTLIFFGFLLGFVPGIPGWPLGLLGLSILAGEYVWARRLLKRVNQGASRLRDVILPRWTRRRKRPPETNADKSATG